MKLNDRVKQLAKKKRRSRNRRELWRKTLVILIGYPFVFPYQRVKEIFKQRKKDYWSKHLEELQGLSLTEAITFIEKDMINEKEYVLYNAYFSDAINYANAFYLQNFFGWSWHYQDKHHQKSRMYYDLMQHREGFNKDTFYGELFDSLEKKIRSTYQDVKIERKTESIWSRSYECLILSLEK